MPKITDTIFDQVQSCSAMQQRCLTLLRQEGSCQDYIVRMDKSTPADSVTGWNTGVQFPTEAKISILPSRLDRFRRPLRLLYNESC
jgi:hypothetical protein